MQKFIKQFCKNFGKNFGRIIGRSAIGLYRFTLSPFIGQQCRYAPTCSHYADEAIARYGLWIGGWITLARLLRCHPWGSSGFDPVPDIEKPIHWIFPWRHAQWTGTHTGTGTHIDDEPHIDVK